MAVEELEAVFCRAVREIYAPLDTSGASLFGGRFNPPGIATLYLAPDPDVALLENTRSADWARFKPFAPRRVVCVEVRLSRVIDVGKPANAAALGLSAEDLLNDWTLLGEDSPTQTSGHFAYTDGIEGMLYPSRIDPAKRNLAVFRDNLVAGSHLEIVQADSGPGK